MRQTITDSDELLLETLALLGQKIIDQDTHLARLRREQKTLVRELVLERHIPQAEVARVAIVNRQTVIRWCRDAE